MALINLGRVRARLRAILSHKLTLLSLLLCLAASLGAGLGMAAPLPTDEAETVSVKVDCTDLGLGIQTGQVALHARLVAAAR